MSVTQTPAHPDHLTAQELSSLRDRMQAQLTDLVGRDEALRAQLSSVEAATTNTFVAGAEGAISSESDDEAIAMLHHEQTELVALKDALARMASGHYGWCAACGEAISAARLEAMPEARLCIQCQDAAEHSRRA